MVYKIFGALVLLVAVVSLIGGPASAAKTAGQGMSTIGITAGAIIGGLPDLITGFENARNQGPIGSPDPAVDRNGGGGGGGGRVNS